MMRGGFALDVQPNGGACLPFLSDGPTRRRKLEQLDASRERRNEASYATRFIAQASVAGAREATASCWRSSGVFSVIAHPQGRARTAASPGARGVPVLARSAGAAGRRA
jgi:hypothetical protein